MEKEQTGWELIFHSSTGISPLRMTITFPNPVDEKVYRKALFSLYHHLDVMLQDSI